MDALPSKFKAIHDKTDFKMEGSKVTSNNLDSVLILLCACLVATSTHCLFWRYISQILPLHKESWARIVPEQVADSTEPPTLKPKPGPTG